MATDPLNDIRMALSGAANTVSSAGQETVQAFTKMLQQWLEFNKQSCARTMITGEANPDAKRQAEALEQTTRTLYDKNLGLKEQLAQNIKKDEDQGYTPPRP